MTADKTTLDRRTFLRVAAAGGGSVLLSARAGSAAQAAATRRPRVYILVVDGCSIDELIYERMPRLSVLRAHGTTFPQARSLPIMETIPNHVMMATGVRPDRSGVPANQIYDREAGEIRDLDRPSDLRYPTVLQRIESLGLTSGTVLSKEYLYGIFGTRATYRWEPEPIVPASGHAPDQFTTDALIAMVDRYDPSLVLANFGDVDRVGHADYTGSYVLPAARTAELRATDTQLGRFLDHLRDTGKFGSSIIFVLADHAMDWSTATKTISLAPVVEGDPALAGKVVIAQNGGADLLYWTGPAAGRAAGVSRLREAVSAVEGVLSVRSPGRLRLGAEAGDLVAYCKSGWRFTDPEPYSNPIPGNHGHPATEPIPFFIAGGHPSVRQGPSSTARARPVDIAPTVGALFGLGPPRGGYDGTVRTEAFSSLP